jgi:hypothetical protein
MIRRFQQRLMVSVFVRFCGENVDVYVYDNKAAVAIDGERGDT